MLNEKSPGSVWNVAFVAVALFVAGLALTHTMQPREVAAVTAGAN